MVARKPEVEFVHYAIQIVELAAMHSKSLRTVVLNEVLRDEMELSQVEGEELAAGERFTWL